MTLKKSAVTIAMMLMVEFHHICIGEKFMTYSFPIESCRSDPYIVDTNTMVYMKFEGDLGTRECRQMSFTTPKSAFYSYKLCMKELFYDSPKCQSVVYARTYLSDSYDYTYDDNKITGEGCKSDSYGRMLFSKCLKDGNHVTFELKKNIETHNDYHTMSYNKRPTRVIPDKFNDTFKFQIETQWDYNYGLIGGLTGGIAGFIVLTGVGISFCMYCRRRKRLTGRYCCTCPTYRTGNSKFITEGLSQGFSAECALAGILLCSCVLCRQQQSKEQEPNQCEKVSTAPDDTLVDLEKKLESISGLKDPDTVPLIQCDI
ncbi:uncharacterized protein LOC127718261 isoform X2 [Mytilus californianus]|uniref:uncharacterized protein LOC127718261 isoform X2 n=1 Tax=Mytilus californianus TaxID=6549 RepID=UPI002247F088|nr:uncharacterized protein LOC127718261 isoform X2 [Mytilus californianus]